MANAASGLDSVAGKLSTLRNESEDINRLRGIPYEIILANGQMILDIIARGIEKLVAKPAYALEKALLRNSPSPGWIYG